jgi:diguanylate cyclase (GGDEF)-like protein
MTHPLDSIPASSLRASVATLPRVVILALGLAMIALVGFTDRMTSEAISLTVFYLIPSAFVAWYAGRPLGVMVGIAAGLTWLVAPMAGRGGMGEGGAALWNTFMYAGTCVISALLAGTLRRTVHALTDSLAREQELARVDALTGARNLRAFRELLEPELLRVRRYGRPVTVVYLDADGFKAVNDTHGHAVGDRALKLIAETLGVSLRRTDIVARLGGDEFGVILTDTGPGDAERVLSKAQQRLCEVTTREGWPLTMSIGAVSCLAGVLRVDDVVRRADDLMFEVKRQGKNGLRVEVMEGAVSGGFPKVEIA